MQYKIRTKVKNLEHKTVVTKITVDKSDPENPKMNVERQDVGWFAQFEGSYEALFMGNVEPLDLKVGTGVTILIIPDE